METIIEKLGHLGDGIAPGPVYVNRALPGEVVAGEVEGGRIARPRILTPSVARVSAPCPHYNACGGCDLMHARDDFVAAWKVDVVARALAGQGLDAPMTGIATSPPESRRRAVLAGRRTKKGATLGFHGRASQTLTEIPGCRVVVPAIRAALEDLRALVLAGSTRKGEMTLNVLAGPAGLDVSVTGGRDPDRSLIEEIGRIAGAADFARVTWNGDPVATARRPFHDMGGVQVVPPPGAFVQATKEAEAALLAVVSDIVGDAPRAVDLFSGCGTFALPLSRRTEILAVEGLSALSEATREAWRRAGGLHALTAETRDLFARPLLPSEFRAGDAVVIDPPRAGAEAQMRALADSPVRTLAMVSCNPVSFARDAAIAVAAGFTIRSVAVVDQFRWSPHVEIAARLTR